MISPAQPKTFSTATAAFSLIEILFIIAIISVIISLGLSVTKKREQEAKIEKTALQMQQLLEAGIKYYSDKGTWPQKGEKTFIDNYIPVSGTQDSWGNDYSWCPAMPGSFGECSQKPLEATEFIVETAPHFSANTAELIRGMLPNANIKGKAPNEAVYVQIPYPNMPEVFLTKTGLLFGHPAIIPETPDQFTISGFSCPRGYISKIHCALQDFVSKYPMPTEQKATQTIPYTTLNFPLIEIAGDGCSNAKGGMCDPYYVVFHREKSTQVFQAKWLLLRASTRYYKTLDDFYASYTLNYSIYCCKATSNSRTSRDELPRLETRN